MFFFHFTILRRVCIGCLKVSENLLAGGFLGFEEGVCTAQHLINIPINIMKAIPIKRQAHQYSCGQNNKKKINNFI